MCIRDRSKTSQLNLREFIGLRGMNDIAFEDLTEEFGKSYKLFLIGPFSFLPNNLLKKPRFFGFACCGIAESLLLSVLSVSYTHLDVYKRQIMVSSILPRTDRATKLEILSRLQRLTGLSVRRR